MTHLFHGIAKTTITKLICIKLIDNMCKHKPKNDVNLKKTLTTRNTNKCFKIIMKLSIVFITSIKKI